MSNTLKPQNLPYIQQYTDPKSVENPENQDSPARIKLTKQGSEDGFSDYYITEFTPFSQHHPDEQYTTFNKSSAMVKEAVLQQTGNLRNANDTNDSF